MQDNQPKQEVEHPPYNFLDRGIKRIASIIAEKIGSNQRGTAEDKIGDLLSLDARLERSYEGRIPQDFTMIGLGLLGLVLGAVAAPIGVPGAAAVAGLTTLAGALMMGVGAYNFLHWYGDKKAFQSVIAGEALKVAEAEPATPSNLSMIAALKKSFSNCNHAKRDKFIGELRTAQKVQQVHRLTQHA